MMNFGVNSRLLILPCRIVLSFCRPRGPKSEKSRYTVGLTGRRAILYTGRNRFMEVLSQYYMQRYRKKTLWLWRNYRKSDRTF